ncbi:Cytochrome P450 [Hibiscus syriacus]|uniref:Cytochrome P450 n=1 Tax=Hibiscus syriacus TaxID=106335 RepID=A0A6A3BCP6_HIBSY|nr:Cytochrome P450 [Hibiscus syriacus]
MNPLLCFVLQAWNLPGSCEFSRNTSRFLRDYAVWEINAFLWISLISITYFLTHRSFKLFKLWDQGSKIPGPPSPSFYGHFSTLSKQNLTEVLSDSHGEYGSIVKLWLVPNQLLVSIKEPEVEKRRESLASELNVKLLDRANLIPTTAVNLIMPEFHQNKAKGLVDCKMTSQHMAFTLLGATIFVLLPSRNEDSGGIDDYVQGGLISNMLMRLVTHPEIQHKVDFISSESSITLLVLGSTWRLLLNLNDPSSLGICISSEIIMAWKGSEDKDQPIVEKITLLLAAIYEPARVMPAGPLLLRCSLNMLVQTNDSSWGNDAGQAEELNDQMKDSFVLNDLNENAAFLPFGAGYQKFFIQGKATLFASLLEQYEVMLNP